MLFLLQRVSPSASPPFFFSFLKIRHSTKEPWGCDLCIYDPHLSSRTPLSSQSPSLDSSGRKVISREQTVRERGRTRQASGAVPCPQL